MERCGRPWHGEWTGPGVIVEMCLMILASLCSRFYYIN
uniref:Uncharacterized protein n=1 Tax=Triticum urartu TaxID=4572 RepID=A0A8R7Q9Z5_TRIUA